MQIPLPDDAVGLDEGAGAPAGAGPLPAPVPEPLPAPVPEPLPAPVPGLLPAPVPEPLPDPELLAGAGLDCVTGAWPAAEPVRAEAASVPPSGGALAVTEVPVEVPVDASWFAAWRPDGRSVRVVRSWLPAGGALPWAIGGRDGTGAWVLPAAACH